MIKEKLQVSSAQNRPESQVVQSIYNLVLTGSILAQPRHALYTDLDCYDWDKLLGIFLSIVPNEYSSL